MRSCEHAVQLVFGKFKLAGAGNPREDNAHPLVG